MVYGFDLDARQPIGDKIGPMPEEVARTVAPDEVPKTTMNPSLTQALETLTSS